MSSNTMQVMSLRPRNHRRIVHAVHPAPISRPNLRTGRLECGHPFVSDSDKGAIECFRCSGEASTREAHHAVELWSTLNDVLSRPQEVVVSVPPPQDEGEPETRPTIRTRVGEESRTPQPNEIVSCGLCGGLPTLKTCPYCHGTKRKWRYGPRVYSRQRLVLFRRPTLEDVERMGFSRSESVVEGADERRIGLIARAWSRARGPVERWHWEGVLTHHGWVRPPPTMEEVLRKYPKPIREDPEKEAKTTVKLRPKGRGR